MVVFVHNLSYISILAVLADRDILRIFPFSHELAISILAVLADRDPYVCVPDCI